MLGVEELFFFFLKMKFINVNIENKVKKLNVYCFLVLMLPAN